MKGNVIKEVVTIGKINYKNIITYKYLDTFLTQTFEQVFEKGRLTENFITNFTYEFDNKNRIKSKTIKKSSKEISKELYFYNNKNRLDTVFIYNNDTTIWTTNQPFTGIKKLKKDATLKRIKVYDYTDSNKLIIQDCRYPINSFDNSSCRTYETFESDTLDISIEKFWGRRGCVMDSVQTTDTTKFHKKEGLIYFYETTMWDGKTYYTYKKNKLGLIIETTTTTKAYEKKTKLITKLKYYFRRYLSSAKVFYRMN